MTLAEKYVQILLKVNQLGYQEILPTALGDPVLVSLLSESFIERQSHSLDDMARLSRELRQQEIDYLISIVDSQEYLTVLRCLRKANFKAVRKSIEDLFFKNKIQHIQVLGMLLTQYHINDGAIERSQELWHIINKSISYQQIIPLLQKLSIGKTPEKQELNKIFKYLNLLRGSHFQPLSKIDLQQLVSTKHSLIKKDSLLIGIVRIVLGLTNTRIKHKMAHLIVQMISTSQEKWVQIFQVDALLQLVQASITEQSTIIQNKEAQNLIGKLVSTGTLRIQKHLDALISHQSLIRILLSLYKSNPSLINPSSLIKIQLHLGSETLYKQYIQTISPFPFSTIPHHQSLQIINSIPKHLIGYSSQHIKLPEITDNKLSKNQSLLCLYYLNDFSSYGDLINIQIKELRKQSYFDIQDIISVLKHVEYLIQYSAIDINPQILFLIQQLFSHQMFSLNVELVYENISLQPNGGLLLKKHYQNISQTKSTLEETHPYIIQILARTSEVPLTQVEQFVSSIHQLGVNDRYLESIYTIHLNYHLPKSPYLQPSSLNILKDTNILTSLIEKYHLKIQPQSLPLSTLHPSPKFIKYLQSQFPALSDRLFKQNWYYYQQTIKNGFFKLYQQCLLPTVYPIHFRGNLFNDIPLVFQYLSHRVEQSYFSNYSAYMSLLYLEILCSDPNVRRKDIIKYLFDKVVSANKSQQELNGQYYTNLIWWRLFVFASYHLLDSTSSQEIQYIIHFLLKDIENKALPVLRQNMELLFYKLLCLDHNLVHLLIDKLKNENAVNVNAPVILSLGLFMLDNKSELIFSVLITYISSHTAYVRAMAQYYCFEYLKQHGSQILEQQPFLRNIMAYTQQSKESKKLMRNIRNGVQLFDSLVKNLNIRTLLTINFQKCEDNVISPEIFSQLEAQGMQYLASISKYIHANLRPIVNERIKNIKSGGQLTAPSFLEYQQLYEKEEELIIVASLLEKPPNFGHLVRTCSQYPNITLCFPTRNILNEPDYKELIPQEFKCSIIEIKERDLMKYLNVQKRRNYKLIALEQTSNSVTIDKFEFPKRAVIVLGNERIGMNSTVIDMMDHLVEIQQFGKVRSLNVHVSSVILLWSYKQGYMI